MSIARRTACVATLAATLILLSASAAVAHVTVSADNTSPGGVAKYTVRVPNESDSASTTKVEVKLPAGFEEVTVQPKPGWTVQLESGVLAISDGKIGPGQFDEFSFSAQNPKAEGDLTFPAVQTYDDGKVVNWTGQPDAAEPAPVVKIAGAPEAEHTHGGAEHSGAEAASAASDRSVLPVAIAALLVGLLGLGIGGAAFARARHA